MVQEPGIKNFSLPGAWQLCVKVCVLIGHKQSVCLQGQQEKRKPGPPTRTTVRSILLRP